MVSDLVDEYDDYLRLSDEQFEHAKAASSNQQGLHMSMAVSVVGIGRRRDLWRRWR